MRTWLSRIRLRLRNLFPPSGPRYELFDTSFYLLWIVTVAYVIFPVPPATRDATGAPLYLVSERDLGLFLGATAIAGIVLAYSKTHWNLGYVAARWGGLFMAGNFIVSLGMLVAADRGWIPPVPDPNGTARVALIYLMVYGWASRRLKRDNGAA